MCPSPGFSEWLTPFWTESARLCWWPGVTRETQSLQISCFLLSVPSPICAQAFPVLATWLQSQQECGVFCQLMTIASGVKEENVLIPVDSGGGHPWLYYFFLRCWWGEGGRTKVGCVSGEGRGIAKKKKASCTQKGMGPSKAKKCHPNCASERRKWAGFLIYGYARGSLRSPRFIASCDESLCACEARTHRGPRFFMNCKFQFMCAHHVPVLSHFNVQCPGHFRRVWLKTGRIIPEARVHFYCTTLSGAGGCPEWTMHVSGVLLQGCQWGKQCVILKKAVDGAVTQEK